MILDEDEVFLSPSYFWSCITLSEDCPFYTTMDPKLHYFGIAIAVMYGVFLIIVVGDLSFYLSLDNMQRQIDYYLNLITNKVKRVQVDQRRLMTTKERTEKQLKRSRESIRTLSCLRGALCADDPQHFNMLTSFDNFNPPEIRNWSTISSSMEY